MPMPMGNLHRVFLTGTGTPGESNEDLDWHPTGINLDAERPRAMLIEDVHLGLPSHNVTAASVRANITSNLAMSTGRDEQGTSAPRPRLRLATRSMMSRKPTTGAAGASESVIFEDNTEQLRGTLWVCPLIGLIQSTDGNAEGVQSTGAWVTYRVVEVDFDLAHALWDLLDEAADLDFNWWNV